MFRTSGKIDGKPSSYKWGSASKNNIPASTFLCWQEQLLFLNCFMTHAGKIEEWNGFERVRSRPFVFNIFVLIGLNKVYGQVLRSVFGTVEFQSVHIKWEALYIFHLILLCVTFVLDKLRIMFCLLTSSFFCTQHTLHLPPRGMTVMRLKMADKRETSAWSDTSCLSCISVRMHLITDSSSESDLITCKSFACNRESINIIQHNPLPHQGDQSSGIFVKVHSASPAAWRGEILLTWGWDQSLC